jgi:hypothetical protein
MLTTLGDLAETDKPEAIALVAPYVDTFEISSRRPFPSALLKIVKANSGSMIPDVARDRNDPQVIWHYLLAINQPSRYLPSLLQWYHDNIAELSIYRLHLALDVIEIAPGYSRQDVIEMFEKLQHLRHRRSADEMHDEAGTLYSIKTAGRKARPYKNTGLYTSKPSKLTGEANAIHFEIRLERKRAVEAAGIITPGDVIFIDPPQFVMKHLTTKDHRPILEKIIQRSIRAVRSHPMLDTEARIRAQVRRYGLDHTSVFARAFPKQFERVKHRDSIGVENRLNWASPYVQCDEEVGKLHCLLPHRRKRHRERLIIRERL